MNRLNTNRLNKMCLKSWPFRFDTNSEATKQAKEFPIPEALHNFYLYNGAADLGKHRRRAHTKFTKVLLIAITNCKLPVP